MVREAQSLVLLIPYQKIIQPLRSELTCAAVTKAAIDADETPSCFNTSARGSAPQEQNGTNSPNKDPRRESITVLLLELVFLLLPSQKRSIEEGNIGFRKVVRSAAATTPTINQGAAPTSPNRVS
mmetsp:Transcript_7731/g.8304  ORF Transcript_7731/g.8304 Transcript_7731/m.8304 type:complete len:125 (+) Transcript_7731:3242-3616(+)